MSFTRRLVLFAPALGALLLIGAAGAQQFDQPRREIESATIVLYPDGFSPNRVTLREGRVLLRVLNRAGIDAMPLLLQRNAEAQRPAEKVREADVPRAKRAWQPEEELLPGDYTLSVKGFPDWICRVVIVPDPDKKDR